ncbi:MAG TPA: MlaD family protein [Caulobacteraceae bacterium]|jgi:phospholipid/cholesterol/gamma-HCH transport system substrate-binding protein|nr:MlaD family protein [Caulobacteraceae bacterium]
MERNAHYAAIGLATSVLVVGLLLFVVWFAKVSLAHDYDIYRVEFVGAVRGLSKGGEVHFNGIKVGEVTDLRLEKGNANIVIATIRVTSDVPVKTDTYAQLEPQGITGVSYIQLSAGAPKTPLLKSQPLPRDGGPPIIHSVQSPLSELLEGSGALLTKANDALNRVNRVLSDDNIKQITATMKDVREVADNLNAHKDIIEHADEAIKNANVAMQNFTQLAQSGRSLVDGDGKQAVDNISKAAADIDAAAKQVNGLIAKLSGPTTDFASSGLPQLTATAASLQQTSESLNELIREIRASPQGLVAKPPSKEVKVPQ